MSKRSRRALTALALLGALLWASSCWGFGQPVAPTAEELRALEGLKGRLAGEIVFSSRRDGKWRLFRILPDGHDLVRLSTGTANHTRPQFVMGGRKLIYQSDGEGLVQIWMAEPDLSQPQRLSPPGVEEWFQGLAADGRLMLVAKAHTPQGYVLRDLKGGQEKPVDFAGLNLRQGQLDGMLSPDGRKIALQFKPEAAGQPGRALYVADLEPSGRAANLRRVADGCFAAWRSDSKAFLTSQFAVFRGAPGTEIWLADERAARDRLTRDLAWNYFPAFSPDEQWLVYAASPLYSHDQASGHYEIYVKRLQDKHPVRLTFHTAPNIEPTWRKGRSKVSGRDPDFVYEGEEFAHAPAQVVEDPAASGGRAAYASQEAGRAGAVVYGQYDVLAPGRYVARFRVKFSPPQGQSLATELDVSVENGQRILAKRVITGADITHPGRYQDYDLRFNSAQLLTGLECRVSFYPQVADVWVDLITVKPASSLPWYQPLKNLWTALGP